MAKTSFYDQVNAVVCVCGLLLLEGFRPCMLRAGKVSTCLLPIPKEVHIVVVIFSGTGGEGD